MAYFVKTLGPRDFLASDGLNEPDTDWQPTVCYVGDMKQSIYAFRQAEVASSDNLLTDFVR